MLSYYFNCRKNAEKKLRISKTSNGKALCSV